VVTDTWRVQLPHCSPSNIFNSYYSIKRRKISTSIQICEWRYGTVTENFEQVKLEKNYGLIKIHYWKEWMRMDGLREWRKEGRTERMKERMDGLREWRKEGRTDRMKERMDGLREWRKEWTDWENEGKNGRIERMKERMDGMREWRKEWTEWENEGKNGRKRTPERIMHEWKNNKTKEYFMFPGHQYQTIFVFMFSIKKLFSRHLIMVCYSVSIGDCRFIEGWFTSSASRSISLGLQYEP
jgi:hypothetical protein